MNKPIVLLGAGGHAKVVIEIIELNGGSVKFINETAPLQVQELFGYPVTTVLPDSNDPVIIAIGSNRIRARLAGELLNEFGTAIHPAACISKRCSMGVGTVVMGGVTINADTKIGQHCIINTNAAVDHECMIGDFVHVSPGVTLAGNVKVGNGTHIGTGCSVIPGVNIGQWVTIGAGAAIIEDVPDYAVVVGVPGTIIKYNQL